MTRDEFLNIARTRVVFLDGATGSNLQKRGMPAGVCPEDWILKNPQVLIELQSEFLQAGSDIILAPTFTANRIKLAEYGQENRIAEINKGLVALSKAAVKQYQIKTGSNKKVYIAADLTMTGVQVEPIGTMPFEELVNVYKEQLSYILPEGVDLVIVETMISLQECRAALLAVKETCDLPVLISMSFEENKRTLYGTDPRTAIIVLQSMGADAVGVNCSTGPDKMLDVIREMKEYASIPVIAKPNAGIPMLVNGQTVFPMEAEEFSKEMEKLVKAGAGIVGGCCGTTPEHIGLLHDRVKDMEPQPFRPVPVRALTTERRTVEIPLEGHFIIVGERINPTGKKDLQAELAEGSYELVSEMAEEQARLGARILDINVGMNGIDEKEVMLQAMQAALTSADLPLSIDSSHVSAMEAALRLYPGRALINSISLEKEKLEKLLPAAKKYGAMFILLPLSDQGLPKDINEKKQIIHTILGRAFGLGLTKEDIVIDGLVNTVGANKAAAIEALQTIRYCKEELGIAAIVGLSNISFGLPERQYVNSTFLAFAIQSGLTMAIANPSQDLLVNTALAADMLRGLNDAAEHYIERIALRPSLMTAGAGKALKGKSAGQTDRADIVSAPEPVRTDGEADIAAAMPDALREIFDAVVKGKKKNILPLVEKELNEGGIPQDLIDQVLIPAITEVGRLYDRQVYFLPQLIAGAETMKAAIDYLEPGLLKRQGDSKGTIVIATVSGDIHDIGKNLVTLMLGNYGFRMVDLGKDVPSEKIIEAAKAENADIIALSALMTTTMVEMKNVVKLAKEAGLKAKIIIGGAVTTESYAREIGADGYSEDAQSAVALVKRLLKK